MHLRGIVRLKTSVHQRTPRLTNGFRKLMAKCNIHF